MCALVWLGFCSWMFLHFSCVLFVVLFSVCARTVLLTTTLATQARFVRFVQRLHTQAVRVMEAQIVAWWFVPFPGLLAGLSTRNAASWRTCQLSAAAETLRPSGKQRQARATSRMSSFRSTAAAHPF
jgi:hypothetical protein